MLDYISYIYFIYSVYILTHVTPARGPQTRFEGINNLAFQCCNTPGVTNTLQHVSQQVRNLRAPVTESAILHSFDNSISVRFVLLWSYWGYLGATFANRQII